MKNCFTLFALFQLIIGADGDSIVLKNKCIDDRIQYCVVTLEAVSGDNDCQAFTSALRHCRKSLIIKNALSDSHNKTVTITKNDKTLDVKFNGMTSENTTLNGKQNKTTIIRAGTVLRSLRGRVKRETPMAAGFIYDCECISVERKKRQVLIEKMFGLNTYVNPETSEASTETELNTVEKKEGCDVLTLGTPYNFVPSLTVSFNDISSIIMFARHSTTARNCWQQCNFMKFSKKETCVAVGFVEANARKAANDCFLLSRVPVFIATASTANNTVDIYKIC